MKSGYLWHGSFSNGFGLIEKRISPDCGEGNPLIHVAVGILAPVKPTPTESGIHWLQRKKATASTAWFVRVRPLAGEYAPRCVVVCRSVMGIGHFMKILSRQLIGILQQVTPVFRWL